MQHCTPIHGFDQTTSERPTQRQPEPCQAKTGFKIKAEFGGFNGEIPMVCGQFSTAIEKEHCY